MKPVLTVWRDPRGTIAELVETRPNYLFIPLAAVYGIVLNLHNVHRHGVPPDQGLGKFEVLGINILFGAVFGVALLTMASYPLTWVSRWLGGTTTPRATRTVLAWSAVPCVPLLACFLLLASLGPSSLLVRTGGSPIDAVGASFWMIVVIMYMGLRLVLTVWLCAIAVVGLSEVNGFSIGRSIASYLIVGVVLGGGVFAVVIGLASLTGGA